ncbi:MAG: hypothetical protein ACD_7C00342G0001 [uncultured bacterium]|nr:MAG: hypothetical protein ACD_7C00342G0001 [uncultured bacterium]
MTQGYLIFRLITFVFLILFGSYWWLKSKEAVRKTLWTIDKLKK